MELREIGEIGEMAISSHQWQSPLNRGRRKWSSARMQPTDHMSTGEP
jgi:hypothetical protein